MNVFVEYHISGAEAYQADGLKKGSNEDKRKTPEVTRTI